MRSTPRSGQAFTRIVVPMVLFIAVVAGVAWLVQNLPSVGVTPETATPGQTLIKFAIKTANWDQGDNKDPKDIEKDPKESEKYVKEYEPGQDGHYDFPIENISANEVEAGLDRKNCTCTEVKMALYPAGATGTDTSKLSWTVLTQVKAGDKADEVVIPVGGKGVVRLVWKTKEALGQNTLLANLWFQPKGKSQERKFQDLTARINVVRPLQFLPENLDLGQFRETKSGVILCWSATRNINGPDDKVEIDKNKIPPGFEISAPVPAGELKHVQEELKSNKSNSRAKSAVRITVKATEKTANAYMTQGPFIETIPLLLNGQELKFGPKVSGYVQSDIDILGSTDGKINLGQFDGQVGYNADNTLAPFFTTANPRLTTLTLLAAPDNVDVRLEASATENRWLVHIRVPPNTTLPSADHAIVLRSQKTKNYLAYAATTWLASPGASLGPAQIGPLPDIATTAYILKQWGSDTRQIRMPVIGTVYGAGSR